LNQVTPTTQILLPSENHFFKKGSSNSNSISPLFLCTSPSTAKAVIFLFPWEPSTWSLPTKSSLGVYWVWLRQKKHRNFRVCHVEKQIGKRRLRTSHTRFQHSSHETASFWRSFFGPEKVPKKDQKRCPFLKKHLKGATKIFLFLRYKSLDTGITSTKISRLCSTKQCWILLPKTKKIKLRILIFRPRTKKNNKKLNPSKWRVLYIKILHYNCFVFLFPINVKLTFILRTKKAPIWWKLDISTVTQRGPKKITQTLQTNTFVFHQII